MLHKIFVLPVLGSILTNISCIGVLLEAAYKGLNLLTSFCFPGVEVEVSESATAVLKSKKSQIYSNTLSREKICFIRVFLTIEKSPFNNLFYCTKS